MLVNNLIAETYSLNLDDTGHVAASSGVMMGTVPSCAQAVLDGTVRVYVSDVPVLQFLAYTYLDAPDLYVSAPIRNNPLSWAFPKGSPLRPPLDAAIMKMMVNGTWLAQYNALVAEWFPSTMGTTEPDPTRDLIVGPFVAAMVLTGMWLLGLAGEEGWRAVKARKAAPGSSGTQGEGSDAEAGAGAATAPLEQRIAEALAHEAFATAAAAQAAADRAAKLLAELGARAPASRKIDAAAARSNE